MNIYTIGDDIEAEWHWIEPFVKSAYDRNVDGCDPSGALKDIKGGRSLALVIEDQGEVLNVAVIDILPDCLHLRTTAGKKMAKWVDPMSDAIDAICKGLGLAYQSSLSRKGMLKYMLKRGFKVHSYYLVREVTT